MSGSSYDDIAAMYDELWANHYLPGAWPALEQLFFGKVPRGARVLDLCCGSGHVTAEVVARGYQVTGVDSSEGLIEIARRNLPQAEFEVQDARHLKLAEPVDAALSTFDSLNHLLCLDDLRAVFHAVHAALADRGLFVFDMNLDEAYTLDFSQWMVNLRPRAVGLSRGLYDRYTHRAQTELIWFTQGGNGDCWQRRESVVEEQCYEKAEILGALEAAGFRRIEAHHGVDLGVDRDLGFGRYFFTAIK